MAPKKSRKRSAPMLTEHDLAEFDPHLHRPLGDSIAYGHYEDPTPAQAATRQCIDMQGNQYHCSGYRLLHWTPSMRTQTCMLTYHSVSQRKRASSSWTHGEYKLASERVRADYWMQYLNCTRYKMFIYYLNVYIIYYMYLYTLYIYAFDVYDV